MLTASTAPDSRIDKQPDALTTGLDGIDGVEESWACEVPDIDDLALDCLPPIAVAAPCCSVQDSSSIERMSTKRSREHLVPQQDELHPRIRKRILTVQGGGNQRGYLDELLWAEMTFVKYITGHRQGAVTVPLWKPLLHSILFMLGHSFPQRGRAPLPQTYVHVLLFTNFARRQDDRWCRRP